MSVTRRRVLIAGAAAALLPASPVFASPWSVDAGPIKVSNGLWPTPANMPDETHFENLRLRMPDGVHLNALLYLPGRVKSGARVGTQLCVDPYRAEPNGWQHGELLGQAQDGFAALFLDVRGTGGSEGTCPDEYTEAEYADTVHVIDWISRQPWSNGAVGMYGTSYSAFNSIWTAANYKPPALKAIFVRGGTDNRYTDDVHSPGGIMMMVDGSWALGMITDNATPGAPDYDLNSQASLDRWNTPPWISTYLDNQLDGPHYWRGSLAPDRYGMLTTPTYLAGGYLDMYQNFVPRIMRNAPALTHGILGPWHHSMTWPGAVLNWRRMQSRWFDYFLHGSKNGVDREPRVTFYMPSWRRQAFRDKGAIPGEWRFARSWPDTVFQPGKKLFLQPRNAAVSADPAPAQGGALAELPGGASALRLRYVASRGGTSESIGPDSYEGFYGIDSREDDVWALCFDTPALREPVEILGFVKAHLHVTSTAPQANWIVRVNDLAPDGTSYIVTYGFLNGTHRHSHVRPEALVPGEAVELDFDLFCTGYRFDVGHRIRVAVTNAYFPVVWPSPYPMVTTLFTGGDRASFVALPVLAPQPWLHGELPVLSESAREGMERAEDQMAAFELTRDIAHGGARVRFQMGPSEIGCEVSDTDPATASLTVKTSEKNVPLGSAREIESRTEGALRSTVDEFRMDVTCTLLENGRVVRTRQWRKAVKRQFV
jgi:putative CocE/NonD family hydrolase